MVYAGGTAPPARGIDELPEPTWALLMRRGLPTLAAEGVLPIAAFYAALKVWGLTAAILVGTAVAVAIVVWQLRRGQQASLAQLTLVFLVVQAAVGLASHSATVYLAQPVILSAAWGIAYLVSAAVGRPLIGLFAQAWYPFPPAFRASAPFQREFGMQSVVWGVYCLARAALRLVALLGAGVGGFIVISFVTGGPFFVVLVAWGLWHARRSFSRLDEQVFA